MKKQYALEDIQVPVKIKLAALWTSFMFLYIYIDYFHLYMPGMLSDLQNGRVFKFDVSQGFLMAAFISVSIPALMIYLSLTLPAKANRCTNIILGALYIPYSIFNLVGEAWMHMALAAAMEVLLMLLVIRYAWKWPSS